MKNSWGILLGVSVLILLACGRPDDLDLSETYFPMGLDYEWTYERDDGGWGVTDFDEWGNPIESSWHDYDTFTIAVKDSLLITRGWEFELEGGEFRDVCKYPKIIGNKIKVFDRKLPMEPEETHKVDLKGLEVLYHGDTLIITLKDGKEYGPDNIYRDGTDESTSRIKGIGVVEQSRLNYSIGGHSSSGTNVEDRLLWFVKNGDTIWNHEDTITTILF